MMQSMKGATQLLGNMNRQMNLPALQRIAMEFEKENDIMDQRQEMRVKKWSTKCWTRLALILGLRYVITFPMLARLIEYRY
jgi:hypothetical protein